MHPFRNAMEMSLLGDASPFVIEPPPLSAVAELAPHLVSMTGVVTAQSVAAAVVVDEPVVAEVAAVAEEYEEVEWFVAPVGLGVVVAAVG